jgi:hypothetical protein
MLVVLQILEAMHASECELCRGAGTAREEGSVLGAQPSEPAGGGRHFAMNAFDRGRARFLASHVRRRRAADAASEQSMKPDR